MIEGQETEHRNFRPEIILHHSRRRTISLFHRKRIPPKPPRPPGTRFIPPGIPKPIPQCTWTRLVAIGASGQWGSHCTSTAIHSIIILPPVIKIRPHSPRFSPHHSPASKVHNIRYLYYCRFWQQLEWRICHQGVLSHHWFNQLHQHLLCKNHAWEQLRPTHSPRIQYS